jgi:hypothetical protein
MPIAASIPQRNQCRPNRAIEEAANSNSLAPFWAILVQSMVMQFLYAFDGVPAITVQLFSHSRPKIAN